MGKVSKATKKFQSKHLKHTLDHRKKLKDHAKRTAGRRGNKTEEEKQAAALTKEDQKLKQSAKEEVFKDMKVEEFFDNTIDIPKMSKNLTKDTQNKNAENNSESDQQSSAEDEEDVNMDMHDLAEKDPDFYKYLAENEPDLLSFKASNPLDDISDEGEEEGDEDVAEKPVKSSSDAKVEVDMKLVTKWKKDLKKSPSFKTIRSVVAAFKAAVNMNKEENVEDYKFSVLDEKAFHELMFIALVDMPKAVQKLTPYKVGKNETRNLPSSKNVSKLSSVLKAHLPSLILLLSDINNTDVASMILHSTFELLPYFISFRRLLKELITQIVEVWSTTRDVETQIAAFAFLNNASREYKKALLEIVLKATYSTFIKSCRKTNIRNMPLINFQKNSAAELFGIDEVISYQSGFEYIRQLAIHLRNSINATTKRTSKVDPTTAYKIIYNWQFCHSLDFWSRVIAIQCNPEKENGHESPLRQLIYPLVQVTIGVIRLIPTAQFFPLRFYLIRSLIRISQNTGVFIPIYPLLSEILSSTAFTKKPKKSTLPAFDFDHNIKCTQAYLGTRIYQEGLAEQFVDLLGEYFVLYCKSVSFPELTTLAVISLRRYIKHSENAKFNKMLQNVVDKINQNTQFILKKRGDVDFGPNNRSEVERFLNDITWKETPLGSWVAVQREVKEEKARLLRESLESDDEQGDEEELSDGAQDIEMDDDNSETEK
ncbi:nucleolar complex protein 2 [Kluyveromyces marxianus]|uniref:Nucleolar complex protein 2 n=2 Tax=Kluyveromyces marxianus TaxID=4911 RepID=W0TF06_KLUMD|nr:nucleolar complex protein 2 [Kluyveromyces marxianus DMKU3-1042]QGN16425.1 nucleolar complex protein 2 [Kluyveromyces marxianus]BAO40699.1 nucleolar complex protein 2 [Kluyveromyces marxianus DMKU3-1042]